jgi:methionyl-tRNA formyltransferase
MKIVFMGTPQFAVPCLRRLYETEEVAAVFTQPDKPRGRGNKFTASPVKEFAESKAIPVYQPVSMKKGNDAAQALKILKDIAPELIIVAAFGQILPQEILDLPKHGCICIHASLLPKFRGAAPIQYAIMDGERVTGITSMQMDSGVDTGDMLISSSLVIGENETAPELSVRLSFLGADVMTETINAVKSGTLSPVKQGNVNSSYAGMIAKEQSCLDFTETAETLRNKIHAVTGFGFVDGKRFKIFRSFLTDTPSQQAPGTLIQDGDKLYVNTGDNLLGISELQTEGGKRQSAETYLNGHTITDEVVTRHE